MANIFTNSNLTPRERILLQVHSKVQEDVTGVPNLTKSDIATLQNWRPKYSREAEVYLQLYDAWILEGHLGIEVTNISNFTQLQLVQAERNILLLHISNFEFLVPELAEKYSIENEEALEYIFKNCFINYDKLVLQLDQKTVDDLNLEIIEKNEVKLVTSKSIYYSNSNIPIIQDLQTQIDYLKNFGFLLVYIQKSKVLQGYYKLLSLKNIYSQLSQIFAIDLDYGLVEELQKIEGEIMILNFQLSVILSSMIEEDSVLEVSTENLLIKLENTTDQEFEVSKEYQKRLDNILILRDKNTKRPGGGFNPR